MHTYAQRNGNFELNRFQYQNFMGTIGFKKKWRSTFQEVSQYALSPQNNFLAKEYLQESPPTTCTCTCKWPTAYQTIHRLVQDANGASRKDQFPQWHTGDAHHSPRDCIGWALLPTQHNGRYYDNTGGQDVDHYITPNFCFVFSRGQMQI